MLQISNLTLSYGQRVLLRDFRLELPAGAVGVLTGVNGCGKSSILNAISGVIPQYVKAGLEGKITWGDTDLRAIPLTEKYRYLWYSLSDPSRQFFFPTCEAELAFALENLGVEAAEIRRRIEQALARFGLERELMHSPLSLSGGQRSLLLCAMAEALDPQLFLLDEPGAGLSESSLILLQSWLHDLKGRNKAVLLAEHNTLLIGGADLVFPLG